jgi:hypothetical protein
LQYGISSQFAHYSMPFTPAIIDLEASGFGAASYPIEVGFVLPDGFARCSLIQPAVDWNHWDANAEQIHGISREFLFLHGKPATEVADMLNEHLRGQIVYSDAWGQDYAWLAKLFEEAERAPAFKLEHLARIVPDLPAARWNEVRERIEEELRLRRHRASADARVLQLTWLALCGDSTQA